MKVANLLLVLCVIVQKHLSNYILSNISNDCATLKIMSRDLNDRIKNPDIKMSKSILEDIEKFNDVLWYIREAIRDGNTTVMEDIKPIINVTLPSFVKRYETLQKKVNKPQRKTLYTAFNWTDKVRKRFEFLCVEAKFHWETLQVVYDLRTRNII